MYEWLRLYLAPEEDAGGGDDDGGGDTPAPEPASPKPFVLGDTVEGVSVPEKFRGKGLSALLKSYGEAESRATKLSQQIKQLKGAKPAEPTEPDGPLVDMSGFLESAIREGKLTDEVLAKMSKATGQDPHNLQMVARAIHNERVAVIQKATSKLAEELKTEIDGVAMIQAAVESGLFTQDELDQFDVFVNKFPDSIEPYRIIAKRLQDAGVDLAAIEIPNPEKPKGRFPLKKGTADRPTTEASGFRSRRDYLEAVQEAGNDPAKKRKVQERLAKSKIASWTDRVAAV